jgi:hypothetical protein
MYFGGRRGWKGWGGRDFKKWNCETNLRQGLRKERYLELKR